MIKKERLEVAAPYFQNLNLKIMKNPTSKQVFGMIETLKEILPFAQKDSQLSMGDGSVCNPGHECGTPHCHGGWYAIAKGFNKKKFLFFTAPRYTNFLEGAKAMANDLGFYDYRDLEEWAKINSDIWGSSWGSSMFCSSLAFVSNPHRPVGAKNMQDIIDHWTDVGKRLYALENKHDDITKELASLPISETLDLIKNETNEPQKAHISTIR